MGKLATFACVTLVSMFLLKKEGNPMNEVNFSAFKLFVIKKIEFVRQLALRVVVSIGIITAIGGSPLCL
jgi:hypothetical protein